MRGGTMKKALTVICEAITFIASLVLVFIFVTII